eukprot:m.137828 g.137828  ORF g.137828 m.137828 type:complete len:600 (-) comp29952_c0_seq1:190-1989(-)
MNFVLENAATVVSAALPVITDHFHHTVEKSNAIDLHEQTLAQDKQFHHIGTAQNQALHEKEIELAKRLHVVELKKAEEMHLAEKKQNQALHRNEIELAKSQHRRELKYAQQWHNQGVEIAMNQHVAEMAFVQEAAKRENLRDVWSQAGRKADTLLITATLMFSCFIALLCEGNIVVSDDYTDFEFSYSLIWAFFSAISFFSLLLCIFVILKYQHRMQDYDIYNSKYRLYQPCQNYHETYESFHKCHVAHMVKYSRYTFQIGTFSLVVMACFSMGSRFYHTIQNEPAAFLFMAMSAVGLISVVIVEFTVHKKTKIPGVFVKYADNNSTIGMLKLQPDMANTIESIKDEIAELENIAVDQIRLTIKKYPLPETELITGSLADYGTEMDDEIFVSTPQHNRRHGGCGGDQISIYSNDNVNREHSYMAHDGLRKSMSGTNLEDVAAPGNRFLMKGITTPPPTPRSAVPPAFTYAKSDSERSRDLLVPPVRGFRQFLSPGLGVTSSPSRARSENALNRIDANDSDDISIPMDEFDDAVSVISAPANMTSVAWPHQNEHDHRDDHHDHDHDGTASYEYERLLQNRSRPSSAQVYSQTPLSISITV